MTAMPSRALLLEDLPDVAAWLTTLLRETHRTGTFAFPIRE